MTGQLFPTLTPEQLDLVQAPLTGRTFLEGPAGCGKTTVGVERLVHLLESGVSGESILVFVPQRALGTPYYEALRTPGLVAGGMSDVLTIGGLARRMVELFWPLLAGPAGFIRPDLPPTFLTLETAQYYMAHLVRPLLEQGYFDTVVIERNRLYSQILDNLNKAAMVGFPLTEIGERLKSAWVGELAQLRVYENAQECASLFRSYCLEHNLLDFSLQIEIFSKLLWPQRWFQAYLAARYRHLIADNLEENPPVAHDLLREWLDDFDSALLIFDDDAGYRLFLGADPADAYKLREACQRQVVLATTFVTSPEVAALGKSIDNLLRPPVNPSRAAVDPPQAAAALPDPALALEFTFTRYYPEMLDWVADQIQGLVIEQGTPPGEIVVLAPFLSDALRFSLTYRLETRGIPVRAYRPSRALRDEPATRCLLTLAAIAHPDWGVWPPRSDFANTLLQSIAGLDLVRARLLAEIVYRNQASEQALSPFERINTEMQERITYIIGERYEILRRWLQNYTQSQPEALDHFLARLFGEVLSQPGFGFHADFKAGEVTANLIESVQKFRWVAADPLESAGIPLGREYLEMVQDGVIAAAYVESMQEQPEQAVFLAPAYTFLMQNRPVEYQFWLDAGSRSWFERIDQPLTHPYVLSRRWPRNAIWSQSNEDENSRDTLGRLVLGLTRRCRGHIYLGLSRLSEQGFESRGPLLRTIDQVLRTAPLDNGEKL